MVHFGFFLGEYLLTEDETALMAAPYLRMGVMFGRILLGAIIMAATGAPEALMAAFIAFKIVLDVVAHLREHGLGRPDYPAQEPAPFSTRGSASWGHGVRYWSRSGMFPR